MKRTNSPYTKDHINRTKEILTTCPPDCFHGPDGVCILKNPTLGFGFVRRDDLEFDKFIIYPLAPKENERPDLSYESVDDIINAKWVVD